MARGAVRGPRAVSSIRGLAGAQAREAAWHRRDQSLTITGRRGARRSGARGFKSRHLHHFPRRHEARGFTAGLTTHRLRPQPTARRVPSEDPGVDFRPTPRNRRAPLTRFSGQFRDAAPTSQTKPGPTGAVHLLCASYLRRVGDGGRLESLHSRLRHLRHRALLGGTSGASAAAKQSAPA